MDEARIHIRNPTIAELLFSGFFHGSAEERSLLRTLGFQKLMGSNPAADSVEMDSQNWWRKGWNNVRRAGEWPGSVMDDAGSCCSGPKLKYLVSKFKADGKTIYNSRPSRFQYDPLSYELNFDDGIRQDEDYHAHGSSLYAVKPGESADAQTLEKH